MSLLTNLISYWKLDEANGDALDAHNVGPYNLTDSVSPVAAGTGILNGCRVWNAANQRFTHADNADLSTGDIDFSVQAWVKFADLSTTRTVMCKGDGLADDTATEYALYGNSSNEIHFRVGKNGATFGDVAWSATVSTGTWYHVVGWHDSVNNQVGIAVNAGTAVTGAWANGVNDTANALVIGDDSNVLSNRIMSGSIDEVGFWKRVLTSGERTSLYNGGAALAYSSFGGGVVGALAGDNHLLNGGILLGGRLVA